MSLLRMASLAAWAIGVSIAPVSGTENLSEASAGAAVPSSVSASMEDVVMTQIRTVSDGSVRIFTGGYGTIAGFRKYTSEHYEIYYSKDSRSNRNVISRVFIYDTGKTWDFDLDATGRVVKIIDGAQNNISFSYSANGNVAFSAKMYDGYKLNSYSGTVKPKVSGTAAFSGSEAEHASFGAAADSSDPTATVKMSVKACKGWPSRPVRITAGYDYGRGAHYTPVKVAPAIETTATEEIDPLSGFRSAAEADRLVKQTSCRIGGPALDAVCLAMTVDGFVPGVICTVAATAFVIGCTAAVNKFDKVGDAKNVIKGKLSPAISFSLYAWYYDPAGALRYARADKLLSWNSGNSKPQEISLQLPCWDVGQGNINLSGIYTDDLPGVYSCVYDANLTGRLKVYVPLKSPVPAPGEPGMKLNVLEKITGRSVSCGNRDAAFNWWDTAVSSGGNLVFDHKYRAHSYWDGWGYWSINFKREASSYAGSFKRWRDFYQIAVVKGKKVYRRHKGTLYAPRVVVPLIVTQ